ncbi:MAG: flagellar hook-basal body protein [Phycisphaerales bacterium]|nr:flagellar hook-basal body protein [Phycisphaerales bacterium]
MNYGLYQSAGGVLSTMHRYEVLSNNLANVETTAFKSDMALSMQRLPERAEQGLPIDANTLLERLGGGQLSTPTFMAFEQGGLIETGANHDLALQGEGFFVVGPERPRGEQDLALTRDGRLTVDADGQIVMATTGWHLLDDRNKPISVGPGAFTVDERGVVHQRGQEIAQLGLRQVEHPDRLEKSGEGLLRINAMSGTSTPATDTNVVQGALEESTVNPVIAMKDLLTASRALEANVRMMQYQDTILGQAAGTLGKVT